MRHFFKNQLNWTSLVPVAAGLLWLSATVLPLSAGLAVLCAFALAGSVLAAVHHAETVAHKLGEPYGTLVLALVVTAIEAALIVSMMLGGGPSTATLARDAIFAVIMIICTGVVGGCLLIGALKHREQAFRVEGVGTGLSALMVLTALVLVFPTVTTSTAGGTYSYPQLIFVAIFSLVIWLAFVFIQTLRHRDYFLHTAQIGDAADELPMPSTRQTWIAFGFLSGALLMVIGLAKLLSPIIEQLLVQAKAPPAILGIVIAMLVLLPETLAALGAARANRLQTSLNLAIGSALASIGLTIPLVIVLSVAFNLPLTLGVGAKEIVLLVLTFGISLHTVAYGRTNIMQGVVHLVVFAAFLFLNWVP